MSEKNQDENILDKKESKIKVIFKPKSLMIGILILIVMILIISIILIISHNKNTQKEKGGIEITSIEISVKNVLNTSQLKIAEYVYNGVAKWFEKDDDGKQIRVGYVIYGGTVRYGIDFSEINIKEYDDDKLVITLPIPDPDLIIDQDQVKCVFYNDSMKKKYNDASSYREKMYMACLDHLKYNESKSNNIDQVKKYTEDYIKKITSPLIKSSNYKLVIKWRGEA